MAIAFDHSVHHTLPEGFTCAVHGRAQELRPGIASTDKVTDQVLHQLEVDLDHRSPIPITDASPEPERSREASDRGVEMFFVAMKCELHTHRTLGAFGCIESDNFAELLVHRKRS